MKKNIGSYMRVITSDMGDYYTDLNFKINRGIAQLATGNCNGSEICFDVLGYFSLSQGGGGGNFPRFWVVMCPGRIKN